MFSARLVLEIWRPTGLVLLCLFILPSKREALSTAWIMGFSGEICRLGVKCSKNSLKKAGALWRDGVEDLETHQIQVEWVEL